MSEPDPVLRQQLLARRLSGGSPDYEALARTLGISQTELERLRAELDESLRRRMAPEQAGWSLGRKLHLVRATLDANETELAGYAQAMGLESRTLRAWRRGYRNLLGEEAASGAASATELSAPRWLPPHRLVMA